jgi:hypothetical protein
MNIEYYECLGSDQVNLFWAKILSSEQPLEKRGEKPADTVR